MTKNTVVLITIKAPNTTPMPIPAFVPVLSPLDDSEDDALEVPEFVAAALVADASDDLADANDFVATTFAEEDTEDDGEDAVLEDEDELADAAVKLK
jgi:hypothetical protein